ncbi:hypothetical protein H8958_004839 [Nasalis larvatus]
MSLEQKSQHCKPEEGLEVQEEALGLVSAQAAATEEQEAAFSSSPLVPAAGSPGPLQSPQRASAFPTAIDFTLWSNQEEEGPSTFPDLESVLKVTDLIHFLLLKY